jgi:mono/diheme cytochrome c family protein
MGRTIFGVILGLILAPFALLAWFQWGHPPVAVADPPLPMERQITQVPLKARIARELPGNPPMQADEANLTAGAQVYRDQCAVCHGFHGRPSSFAAHMFPEAPALWEKHANSDVVGVSDDPPGETYWKAANGIRLTGMPAFKDTLTDTQIWQVSLLLANADKPLPPRALAIVLGVAPATPPAEVVTVPKKKH